MKNWKGLRNRCKAIDTTEPIWYNTIMARRHRPLIDGDDPKNIEWITIIGVPVGIIIAFLVCWIF
jgi:hypothetical protein